MRTVLRSEYGQKRKEELLAGSIRLGRFGSGTPRGGRFVMRLAYLA